jgi:carbon-monoxide dehydrogenase iron sulfur subunit
MSRHISVRIDRCVGCHTCELACAIAHSQSQDIETMIMEGENPGYRIHVEAYGPRSIPISCQHCEEAACALACPTGAVKRNAAGKPVLVEDERCIGCSMCVQSCPTKALMLQDDQLSNKDKRKTAVQKLAEAQEAGAEEVEALSR